MKTANETANNNIRPVRGVYLMTDIYGNQRKVKISPAEKSMLIELLEQAPKLRTNKSYDDFIYKNGSVRLKFDDLDRVCVWDDKEFKLYPENGLEPLYFEFQEKAKKVL